MSSISARRLAEIAKRVQQTSGAYVAPLVPSYKTDPVAFIRDKVPCIDSKGSGLVPFDLWPYQKEVLRYFWQGGFYFIKKDRQMGFTTTLLAAAVPHKLLYAQEIQGIPCHFHVLADTGEKALDLLRMSKVALSTAKLTNDEKQLLRGIDPLRESTTIRYGMANYVRCHATTGRSVRGYSGNGVLVEEAAFIENLEDVWKSVSAMVSELGEMPIRPSVWLVSSPNGPSYHEELCENASKWDATFLPYDFRQVPGRDTPEWEAQERARLGDDIFEEEHGLRIVDENLPLFNAATMTEFASMHQYAGPVPRRGWKYSKGLDVSGGAGTTAFVVTDLTNNPAQPVFVDVISGSYEEKRRKIAELDAQWPGPLHADGTWDPSFVGSLSSLCYNLRPVRFTGGNDVGTSHDATEQLQWQHWPRRRLISGAQELLGSGRVVVHEEPLPHLWKALIKAKRHQLGETPGRVKRQKNKQAADIMDAFMMSCIPIIPKKARQGATNKPQRIRSTNTLTKRKW